MEGKTDEVSFRDFVIESAFVRHHCFDKIRFSRDQCEHENDRSCRSDDRVDGRTPMTNELDRLSPLPATKMKMKMERIAAQSFTSLA